MKRTFYKGRFIFIPLAIAAFLSLLSFVVMTLWNHLLPDILGASTITFWQAMGLFVLCKILFGFGGKGMHMRDRWRHKCKNMSIEERERFREEMKERMCMWKKKEHNYNSDSNN